MCFRVFLRVHPNVRKLLRDSWLLGIGLGIGLGMVRGRPYRGRLEVPYQGNRKRPYQGRQKMPYQERSGGRTRYEGKEKRAIGSKNITKLYAVLRIFGIFA